jgi:hypothetical protein
MPKSSHQVELCMSDGSDFRFFFIEDKGHLPAGREDGL